MASESGDQRFPKKYRIVESAEYDHVFAHRRSVADATLVVYGCRNELEHPRLGIVASRKLGGAVERNRWKRLIREAFRRYRAELPTGIDLVVIPRKGTTPSFNSIADSLPKLASRIDRRLSRDENK